MERAERTVVVTIPAGASGKATRCQPRDQRFPAFLLDVPAPAPTAELAAVSLGFRACSVVSVVFYSVSAGEWCSEHFRC